jgi:hypothetical protein
MKNHNLAAVAMLGAVLAGCGSITQGIHQDITFTSTPAGAQCDITKKGGHVVSLTTPATVTVRKSKDDMVVTCKKDGYQDASAPLVSGYGIGTFGNIILGGGIGWAIDSSTGADNKYPSSAAVTLVPVVAASPPPPALKPATLAPNS